MLAIRRSAGVVPDVNLRNPLHTGDEERSTLALESRVGVTRSQKQGYQ